MEKVIFCKLKTSLSRNVDDNLQTIRQVHFYDFYYKFSMKISFYPPVNNDKPKFVTFLVFVCTTSSFIA